MGYDDLNDKTAGHAVWLAVCVVYLCNTGILSYLITLLVLTVPSL